MVIMVKFASCGTSRLGSGRSRTFESEGGYMRQKRLHVAVASFGEWLHASKAAGEGEGCLVLAW